MSGERGVRSLSHRALDPARGAAKPLADTELGDRLRLGVLLQGAGLLSLLHRAGWHLAHGWRSARVSTDGTLRVGGAAIGAPRGLPQERLRELLTLLFGETIGGRGDARRAARELQAEWHQSVTAVPVDALVAEILRAAPFLWRPSAAVARRGLCGTFAKADTPTVWIAGPARWRELVLAAADGGDAGEVLAGDAAQTLWRRASTAVPNARGADGAPSRAHGVATAPAWRTVSWAEHQPPVLPEERMALAVALAALGRYRRALAALEGLADSPATALVRARAEGELGDLAGARDALRRIERQKLADDQTAAAAEIAVDVLAGIDPAALERWLERGAELDGEAAARVQVLLAARDAGPVAERRLEGARRLLASPAHAWRWHRVRAQRAAANGESAIALTHLALALGGSRRELTRAEAGGLWSQLGRARADADKLPSAERAFRHAARLFAGCDGERRSRGARYRLAELRLRRGQTQGVAELLEASSAIHARTGDHRAAAFDAVLRARLDLVLGQPHTALAHCRAALADLDRRGLEHAGSELRVLAARALGWLGAPDEAAAELAALEPAALGALEREERPAVLALAGQSEAALVEAAGSPFARLWQAALTGHAAPESIWMELRTLDRYRWARLVLDLELVSAGVTPLYWLRRAAAMLQRVGAGPLAARLEPRKRGGWEAVEGYLRAPGEAALPALFLTAGYPEARLVWSRGAGSAASERGLVDGSGGSEELSAAAAGGLLRLHAPLLDPALRALFALALRDLDAQGARRPGADAARGGMLGGMLGDSPLLLAAVERIALLAPGELPLLILGETGTGKELLAKQVHTLSRRAAGPFVPMNCAAVSEHLLLSELFGHVRGAFTGADRDRVGVFETARGGTVFLDEIGDLPPNAQGMLLRALQEGEIRRVGETLPRKIDVRIVAATHRDLGAMVKAGAFRQDLYYRLRGATVTLPPLRERGEDVVALAEHFLARASRPSRLSARARAVVLGHPWPGNVRELKNCMEVAAVLAGGRPVQPEHIDLPSGPARAGATYHQRVDAMRRDLVVEALQLAGGRQAEAARRLGMTRQALAYLVKQLEL